MTSTADAPVRSQTELKYFNLRGPAEGARLITAAAGKYAELTDTRYGFDVQKFPEGPAAASPTWATARDADEFRMNMNRVPVLIIDDVTIGQSTAIERLLAKRYSLYGASDIEGALIDMVVEHLADIKRSYQDAKRKGADDVATWFKDSLPEWLKKLSATLDSNGYAVGASLSWADIKLYQFVKEYFDNLKAVEQASAPFPKIQASVKAVTANSGVTEYLKSRPETPL